MSLLYAYGVYPIIILRWRHGVVVITTSQLHSAKPKLWFSAGSHGACGMSEICDDENL